MLRRPTFIIGADSSTMPVSSWWVDVGNCERACFYARAEAELPRMQQSKFGVLLTPAIPSGLAREGWNAMREGLVHAH